jgi:hypothetical protein
MTNKYFQNFLFYFSLLNTFTFLLIFFTLNYKGNFNLKKVNVQENVFYFSNKENYKPIKLIKIKNLNFYEKTLTNKINLFKLNKK